MRAWNIAKAEELNDAFAEVEDIIVELMASSWEHDEIRRVLLCVAKGTECMIAMLMSKQTGEKMGMSDLDVDEWLGEFSKMYLNESKKGELEEFVKVMHELSIRYLK